jgi:hypothetical protein
MRGATEAVAPVSAIAFVAMLAMQLAHENLSGDPLVASDDFEGNIVARGQL